MNVIRIPRVIVWISLTLLVLVTTVDGTYGQRRGGRGGEEGGREGNGENEGRSGRRGGRGGPGGMPGGPGGMPGGPGGMPGGPGGMPGGPGGMPGGPDGMPGGPGFMPGGPGGMPGGPGGWGGPGGRRGGFGGPGGGPAGFLARMDANGNGMLDPEESQGPARMFLDRIAGEAKLDLSRPIPLDKVTKAFEDMRNRRAQEGGGDRGRGRGEEGGPGGDGNGPSSGSQAEIQPLVPGFGEPDLFDPVPGFGDLGERFAVTIEEQDMQEAMRTMGRSDTNKDGVLDAEEIRNGRWGEDPLQTDRNRDGKLTINELALRYAIRRNEENGGNSSRARTATSRTASSRGAQRATNRPSTAQNDRQARMMDMIFQRYDSNRSGALEREEWSSFRSDPSGYDTNKDGKITREEFAAGMASRSAARGRGGEGNPQSQWFSRREGRQPEGENATPTPSSSSASPWSNRKSYRTASATERLSAFEGLPEWFSRSDADGDGQVRMSEYATSWTDDVVADFAQFDLNGDGIVTPTECMKAVEAGAVQGIASAPATGGSRSYQRSRDRRPAPSGGETSAVSAAAPVPSSTPAPAAAGPAPAGVSAQYLRFAVGLIQKYDSNKDGVLTADEWSKMNKDYSSADTDKDGRITPAELGAAFSKMK